MIPTALLPALSKEENNALLLKALNNPEDTEARDLFFAHNMRLMGYTAQRFYNTLYDKDELFGLAQLGFLKAYKTFDPSKEVQFTTYASRCMDNEILMFLRKHKRHVDNVQTSLDATIATNDYDGSEMKLEDILTDNDDFTSHHAQRQHLKSVLTMFQQKESKRNQQILIMYFEHNMLQHEIAEHFNLSQSFVSRIISGIIQRLQTYERKCV